MISLQRTLQLNALTGALYVLDEFSEFAFKGCEKVIHEKKKVIRLLFWINSSLFKILFQDLIGYMLPGLHCSATCCPNDTARLQAARMILLKLTDLAYETSQPPPYSPNLSPTNNNFSIICTHLHKKTFLIQKSRNCIKRFLSIQNVGCPGIITSLIDGRNA